MRVEKHLVVPDQGYILLKKVSRFLLKTSLKFDEIVLLHENGKSIILYYFSCDILSCF